jgi:hypothetical protein
MILVYIVLAFELIMIIPMISILKQRPHLVPVVWQLVGLGCFLISIFPPLGLSFISWPFYSGHTKGMEITIVDILMIVIYFSQKASVPPTKLPFRLPMKLYLCAALVSILSAQVPIAALFYSWQLVRMYLVFVVVARSSSDARVPPALLKGLAFGLAIEICYVLYQKLVLGQAQPHGTFSHQNTLGMISNLVFIPFVALILSKPTGKLMGGTPLVGLLIAVATASRATMALSGIGSALAFFQSVGQKATSRKIKFGIAGLILSAVLVSLAISSFQQRLDAAGGQAEYSDYDERAAYETAASMMLTEHPMGIGANNFVIIANTGGYYDRAGVAAVFGSRSGHVHNLYWLTLAELGYLGLVALLLVFFQPAYTAIRYSWQLKGHPDADLLGGIGVALIITYIHSNYEWLLIADLPQYFLAIMFGLVAGLSMKLTQNVVKPESPLPQLARQTHRTSLFLANARRDTKRS